MRLPTEPPTLDWGLATDNISKEVIQNLQEGLVRQDGEAKIQPCFAESWTISPDGQTYTFKLRANLKWSDGQALTAQHFVDAWQRVLDPKTGSEYAYFLFDVKNAEAFQKGSVKNFADVGVKAADAQTLIVTLRSPVAYWIYVPSFWVTFPIRKDLIEKYGDKWTDPAYFVSAGAYVLKQWDHDSKVLLEKNPNYSLPTDPAMPAKAEFRIVKEDSTAVALFENGALDIVRDLPPVQVSTLAQRKEFVISPWFRGFYIGFNVKDPQVSDVRVRRALAMAIDRKEIKSIKSLDPMINMIKSWVLPGLLAYSENRGIDYNPEAAKKLWAELPNRPTKLELWFDQKDFNKIIAENLQSQWKKVLGVDIQLNNQEWKVYLKTLKSKAPAMWRMSWGADYPDPDTFMNLFTCGSGNNFTAMCDKIYDSLVANAAKRATDAERASAYDKAQKILLEDQVAIIPLLSQTNLHLVTQRVSGFHVNPMGDFEFKDLKLK